MFRNYFKIAFRSLLKSRATSFINVSGLSIGMACCIIIFLFVNKEMAYDKFHSKADNIFRVLTIDKALGVSSSLVGITLPALALVMQDNYPEVVNKVRMLPRGRQLINYEQQGFYTEHFAFAEASLFEVFDFQLIAGDTESALSAPNTVVFSESMAKRTFGDEEPIGKRIDIGGQPGVEVVAVMKDITEDSHLDFDVIVSIEQSDTTSGFSQFLNSWRSIAMVTYVELNNPSNEENVESKMEATIRDNDVGENFSVTLQPLADVHLKSKDILYENYNLNKTDIGYVFTLAAVGLFVILIASFNFMNLSTARSANRAQEVGVRKVFGALRRQLINQFMVESIIISFTSFLIALVMVASFGSLVNLPFEQNLGTLFVFNPVWMAGGLVFTLVLGVLSGSYPALMLSKYSPTSILRGAFKTSSKGVMLRKGLVIFQFTISIVMIIGTTIVYEQLQLLRNADKGFNPEQIVTLNIADPGLQESIPLIKNKLEQNPSILKSARTQGMPGRTFGRSGVTPEGAAPEDQWIVSVLTYDETFIELMGMEMVEGRTFERAIQTDQDQGILINEAMANELEWTTPLGKHLTFGENEMTILGVVKDFHFASMRHKIEPLVMFFDPEGGGNLAIKFAANNAGDAMEFIQSSWDEIFPNSPIEFRFFDEEFGQQYASDERFGKLVFSFTWLAIFIACLGLFGLSAFTAEQKTKEIGVRKVLGASVTSIVSLLSKEFTKLIVVAMILASPIAYYMMQTWLKDFAYRIEINWFWFIVSAIGALLIALLTVSYQSVRAAMINPAKSLRCE